MLITVGSRFSLRSQRGEIVGPFFVLEVIKESVFRVYLESFPSVMGILEIAEGTEIYFPAIITSTKYTCQRSRTTSEQQSIELTEAPTTSAANMQVTPTLAEEIDFNTEINFE